MGRCAAAFYLACKHDDDGGEDQYRADDRKGVAKAHHQRLVFYRVAKRDDGLLMGCSRIGHPMVHEITGCLRDPVTDFLPAERDLLADDVGVELFTLGDDGSQHRGADRATEVAQHVADAGRRRRVLRSNPARGHRDYAAARSPTP
jgi:hypothetical protein